MNQTHHLFVNDNSTQQREERKNPRIYNIRDCPSCGEKMFGMPGGKDAHCCSCGYKDPCCGD